MPTGAQHLARRFPAHFRFGFTTSSYQIEGAPEEDGKKPSIWDAFVHTPGRILNGDTGDTACDFYHRYRDDLSIAADIGADIYRFSVSWPRVIPDGVGSVNQKGLDFYNRLLDTVLEKGMAPFMTLFHWDLPLALAGWGGWTSRRTAYAFADFAYVVAKSLGDRLAAVTTINEPWCVTYLGYLKGEIAPGEQNMEAALKAVHTVNLAHGLAVEAVRAASRNVPVGISLNSDSVYPATDRPQDVAAARRHALLNNDVFCGPILGGAYPEEVLAAYHDIFPKIEPGDLATISCPIDYLGINYYQPMRVQDAPGTPYPSAVVVVPTEETPKTAMGWEICPAGLGHLLRDLSGRWKLPPLYITENGSAFDDTVDANGHVEDGQRQAFLQAHLEEVASLIEDGMDIRAYLTWSLTDNFEWAKGYAYRFGLVRVDYDTQQRTLKRSGEWYREFLRHHRLMRPVDGDVQGRAPIR